MATTTETKKNTQLKTELSNALKEKRNLSSNSLRCYTSLLATMFRKCEWEKISDIKVDAVFEYIETLSSIQSKKTLLSSIYLITDNKQIHERFIEMCNEVNKSYENKDVSKKRESQYKTIEEVKQIYDSHLNTLKKSKSPDNYVNYLICAMNTGVLHGTVRRLESCDVKMREVENPNTENFIDFKNKPPRFVYNTYKTSKNLGTQYVEIDKPLLNIIKAWMKINPTPYLLIKRNGNKMSSAELSLKMKELFGFGCDVMRSIYISEYYTPEKLKMLEEMKEFSEEFGHSQSTALLVYRKNIPKKGSEDKDDSVK